MTPKKAKTIYFILLAAALVCAFIGAATEVFALSVVGAILALIAIIVQAVFYRCPACGQFLGRRYVKHCPFCGEELDT